MRLQSLLVGGLVALRTATAGAATVDEDASRLSERGASPVVTEDNVYDVLESRSVVSDILNQIKNAATCAGCQGVLTLLKGLALLGDRPFVSTLQEICRVSHVRTGD